MKKFLYILFISSINFIYSQDIISGKVLFEDEGVDFPISGANVFWQGTSKGVITKSNGEFKIDKEDSINKLIISYIGFNTDTLEVNDNKYITHYLKFSSVIRM